MRQYPRQNLGGWQHSLYSFVRFIRPDGYLVEEKIDVRILDYLDCLAMKPGYEGRDEEYELALVEAFVDKTRGLRPPEKSPKCNALLRNLTERAEYWVIAALTYETGKDYPW